MLTQSKKRLAIAIVVIIVGFLFSGSFGALNSKLTSVQENNNSSFLPKGAEATLASEEIEKFSKGAAFSFPALILFEGAATPEALGVINGHLANVAAVPLDGTDSVIGDFLLEGQPIVAFPSEDGKAILVSVPIDGESIGENLSNEKPVLPAVIEALRKDFRPVAKSLGLNAYVTGPGGILGDLFGAFGSLDLTLSLVTFLVVALILVFVYRSPVLWFIPLLTAFFALSVAGGVIYLLAKSDVLDVDGQSQGILSVLVIGAATDYALLLIARYREELHHFEDRFDAMKAAYKGVWEPIVASGSTVSIALLMLLFSQLSNTAGLGPVGAIGIVSAVLMTLTLLPAFLLIPSTVFWFLDFGFTFISLIVVFKASGAVQVIAGVLALVLNATLFYFAIQRVRKPETARFNRTKFPSGRWVFWPRTPLNDGDDHVLDGTWSKVANKIGAKPRKAWVFTGLALLALAFTSTSLKADGLGTVDSFTSRPESVVGSDLLVKHFPGGEGDPTVIVAAQGKADAVIAAVSKAPGVTGIEYAIDPITQNVQLNDGKVLINVTLDKAPDSVEAGNDIPAIREAAHKADPTSLVGGTSAVYYDVRTASSEDNRLIIPLILLVITIILGFLLRSILSAVVLLGTVVLSYYATLGVCALFFNHVFGFAGGDNSFPLFAFVFLVALGVDYNIFLMTRVREESGKLGTRAGVIKGVTVTGAVITSAGVVLAATFVMLGLIPLVPLRQLGFAVAFGVLLDTIIVRSILVPALVHEIGPKIWWPSKLSKKLD